MLPSTSADLTDEQIQQLEDAKKIIPKVRREIMKARQAGINMDAQEAQLNEAEQNITKLWTVYGRKLTSPKKSE